MKKVKPDEWQKLTCHCGDIELRVKLSEGLTSAQRCNCSFCRRRGAIAATATYPNGVEILKGAEKLTLYEWGTGTAKHYFCPRCGIYTHHRRRSNPNEYGVNLAAIEGIDPAKLGEIKWSDGVNHPSDRKS